MKVKTQHWDRGRQLVRGAEDLANLLEWRSNVVLYKSKLNLVVGGKNGTVITHQVITT